MDKESRNYSAKLIFKKYFLKIKMEDEIKEEKVILNHQENITHSRFYKNNILYREVWYQNESFRLDQDLPAEIWYYENGNKEEENWFRYENKEEGGTTLPDVIRYYENGNIERIHTQIDENGADLVIKGYYENGNKKFESWCYLGYQHRDNDLPAVISYYENGNKENEEWFRYDFEWRDNDKPTQIEYYENGNIKEERWEENRNLHRDDDLPACIKYDENGNKKREEWWINSVRIRSVDY